MGFRMVTGTAAQVLLLCIILPLLALLLGWTPGGAQTMEQVFWEFVDTIDIFQAWAQLINQYAGSGGLLIAPDRAFAAILHILSGAFLEAMLIGFCVHIALQACSVMKKNLSGKWVRRYNLFGLPLLPTFGGVFVGVLLLRWFESGGSDVLTALASGVATIMLMIVGIRMMMGIPHWTSGQRSAFIVSELLNVLLSAAVSVCVSGMATTLAMMSQATQLGLNRTALIGWYMILLGLTLLMLVIAVACMAFSD